MEAAENTNVIARVVLVTPEKAKELLKRNRNNRSISDPRVRQYAEDMTAGKWQMNGQAVVTDINGDLKDGQHRLMAVVRSGVSVPMLLVEGVDENVVTFDRGRVRSALDIIRFAGYDRIVCNTQTVGCAKLDRLLREGTEVASDAWCKEWIDRHYAAVDVVAHLCSAKSSQACRANVKFSPMMLAIIYAYEAGISSDELSSFVEAVRTGIVTSDDQTSAVVIRNDLMARRVPKNGAARSAWVVMFERAIYDYANHIPRRKSYVTTKDHMYMKGE